MQKVRSLNDRDFALIPTLLMEIGNIILQKRTEGYQVNKKEDGTLVTSVDLFASQYIKTSLRSIFGQNIKIVSEENDAWENKQNAKDEYFLIDPIDGTSFFIKGGDFCINIAYISGGKPIFGAIAIPTTKEIFFNLGSSVYKICDNNHKTEILPKFTSNASKRECIIINNRRYINRFEGDIFTVKDIEERLMSMGLVISDRLTAVAAIKYCMLIEGKGDFVVSLGVLRCWDVAAANAIANAMNIHFTDGEGKEINLKLNHKIQVIFASGYNVIHRCLLRSFKDPYNY